MKQPFQRLRRVLVALAAVLMMLTLAGWDKGLLEAASIPVVAHVPITEPQIPEYEQLLSQRRQVALQRVFRIQTWEAEEASHEISLAQRNRTRREHALRKELLAQVSDLVAEGYRQMVLDVADHYGVDPRLVAAVGTVESRWNPNTVGTHGDTGLMQILPSTASWIAQQMGLVEYDLFDPLTNLSMGTWYLQALWKEYGSWDQALAAYNGGPRGARLGADHPYVGRVKQVYGTYEGER